MNFQGFQGRGLDSPLPISVRAVDDSIAMRNIVPVVLLLVFAACSAPTRWEKSTVSDETRATDITECQRLAARQASTYYPSGMDGPLWPNHQSWVYLDQYQDSQRFHAQNQLTAVCMRNKGYALVPVA